MSRVLPATAAFAAAVAIFTVTALPDGRTRLSAEWDDGTVAGVMHVHTDRSDGRSGPDAIAAAAASAGLKFVVLTDHGDGTRPPDPPAYRSGVLCIDALEVSTTGGHYIALGLGQTPYPLGGEARDVVEDVRRLGGFGIAAHPDSPKPELAWQDWTLPVDGVEIVNADTAWRKRFYRRDARAWFLLARSIAAYPWRAPQTMARLLADSPALAAEWMRAAEHRPVVAVSGMDAHSRLELKSDDQHPQRYALPLPGYEPSFRVATVHVTPGAPFSGDAVADARGLMEGIRRGHVYTEIDAWAGPARFNFAATRARQRATQGATIDSGAPVTFLVNDNAPSSFRVAILRGNEVVAQGPGGSGLEFQAPGDPGTYRAEIRDPSREGPPWIVSNPIYVVTGRTRVPPPAPSAGRVLARQSLFDGRTMTGWLTETDPSSLAAIDAVAMVEGPSLRMRFGLSGGSDRGQFAGAAVDTLSGVADYDRVAFSAHAERPMRLSIQVRADMGDARPERWQRSIYVDDTEKSYAVDFNDMRPVGEAPGMAPPKTGVRNILFVVDTTNTAPGTSGRIWLTDVRLEKVGGR
jgi:hypothetical protein